MTTRPPANDRPRSEAFTHLVEVHDLMRSLAPKGADRPALHMSPQAGRTYAFDAAIIAAHPHCKETT